MTKPVRIQRKRAKGYDMHAASRAANGLDCVSVTRPGRWGNPFDIRVFGRNLSLKVFRNSLYGIWDPTLMKGSSDELCDIAYAAHCAFMKRFPGEHPLEAARSHLLGRNLACYCELQDACHADIYLESLYGDSDG